MKNSTRWAISGGVLAAVLAGGGIAVAASGDDEDERPDVAITGEALERASAAALDYVDDSDATVTDTEVGDEEGYYEVEVTRGDGSQVDVHLDESFSVLGVEDEADEAGDDD